MTQQTKARREGIAAGLDRYGSSQDGALNAPKAGFSQAQSRARLKFLAGRLHALEAHAVLDAWSCLRIKIGGTR
jgi:hypothetical protein